MKHLLLTTLKEHGLTPKYLTIGKKQLEKIVEGYTRESGVRNLENKIAQVINYVDRNDPQAIATLKQILEQNKLKVPTIINGGKSRRHKRRGGRKTMKKRHRRTHKKMRGGYVYNTSKELDRASSVISKSSSSRSSSISKTKSNRKHKTRNYRMHK